MGIITTRIMWAARDNDGDLGLFPDRPGSGNVHDTRWGRGGNSHPDRMAISDNFPGFDYVRPGELRRIELTIRDITAEEDDG